MLHSAKPKLLLIGFILLLISIPGTFFLISKRLEVNTNQTQGTFDRGFTKPSVAPVVSNQSPLETLRRNLSAASPSPSADNSTGSSAQYGPSLSLKISIEGRTTDQHTKLFVGIASGLPSNNPQYLLSFNVDVASDGSYSGISLTGLTQGSTYTAYLKGTSQLVKAVSFVMSPTGVNLNGGQVIALTTGDLNQDNVIDQSDLDIAKAALGATPSSGRWNANIDFNLDGVINNFDVAIIQNNLGKIGDSGKWYSTTPVATSSANLITPPSIGGASGHWEWVPGL